MTSLMLVGMWHQLVGTTYYASRVHELQYKKVVHKTPNWKWQSWRFLFKEIKLNCNSWPKSQCRDYEVTFSVCSLLWCTLLSGYKIMRLNIATTEIRNEIVQLITAMTQTRNKRKVFLFGRALQRAQHKFQFCTETVFFSPATLNLSST